MILVRWIGSGWAGLVLGDCKPAIMKRANVDASIAINGSFFDTQMMVQEYVLNAYFNR